MRPTFFRRAAALLLFVGLAACSAQTELTRSDMPLTGMDHKLTYQLIGTPDGANEINRISMSGMGELSPMTEIRTTFTKTNDTLRDQISEVFVDGRPINALAMGQQKRNFGLTSWLKVSVSSYDLRDAAGARACGFKVRMDFSPNGEQLVRDKGHGKGWDALWYYTNTCDPAEPDKISFADSKFLGLVLSEQYVVRLTSDPISFNRGRSVTIVGGAPSRLTPGWWLHNTTTAGQPGVLQVADMVRAMADDLNESPDKWREFKASGAFSDSTVMYAAGDADVFWSASKLVLDREVDYHVFVRTDPQATPHHLIMHPVYNFEWNDWKQNLKAYKDISGINLDDRVDEDTGKLDDPNDTVVKEIEKQGWMNSPNPSLEQIQILDGDNGNRILYAMTVRGYVGAKNSMIMFGRPPGSLESMLDKYGNNTPYETLKAQGMGCPVKYDDEGKKLDAEKQISDEDCAQLLREGPMWQFITENPKYFGFDLVAQMNIKNDGKWGTRCSGSGDSTSCWLYPISNEMNASYMLSTDRTEKAWTIMQLLGEVGVRTLGLSYTSGPYDGTGLLFAMGQPIVRHQYLEGITSEEMPFALDARALQLPGTMNTALGYLGLN